MCEEWHISVRSPEPVDDTPKGARDRTISRRDLYELVWRQPLGVNARSLGITSGALAKICDRMLIPYPSGRYWSKVRAGRSETRRPLLDAPEGMSEEIVIPAEGRSGSRRTRTRLSVDARRSQISEAAIGIIVEDGLHAATMKRIAREIGLSEGHIYNYFKSQAELLVHIARQELNEMNTIQQADIRLGRDPWSRLTLATVSYLHQVASRGPLLQLLLAHPDVRRGLRSEHHDQRILGNYATAAQLEELGVEKELAFNAGLILTNLSLRTGKVLTMGKISLIEAERMSLAIILGAIEDLVRNAEAEPRPDQSARLG
ncbi:TetR/AcrR family transcriptional regulator [Phenylobacterium sp.]|uniref:TetR/AcrR family transcriptional regulator n=1 Tax=Phenylobacterium sp. TaxID=1871053 RepID=UPI0025E2D33F|nr:TetR/AcrR family transcriptional regulator [Phenylobacterium sp.]MBX3482009.1 TetR/AcrR family transcriptional regulator [Phenylobacterium sp.]